MSMRNSPGAEWARIPRTHTQRGCEPTSCNNSLIPKRPLTPGLRAFPAPPPCPSQGVTGSAFIFSVPPRGGFSKNTVRVGTGAINAKILF